MFTGKNGSHGRANKIVENLFYALLIVEFFGSITPVFLNGRKVEYWYCRRDVNGTRGRHISNDVLTCNPREFVDSDLNVELPRKVLLSFDASLDDLGVSIATSAFTYNEFDIDFRHFFLSFPITIYIL